MEAIHGKEGTSRAKQKKGKRYFSARTTKRILGDGKWKETLRGRWNQKGGRQVKVAKKSRIELLRKHLNMMSDRAWGNKARGTIMEKK